MAVYWGLSQHSLFKRHAYVHTHTQGQLKVSTQPDACFQIVGGSGEHANLDIYVLI